MNQVTKVRKSIKREQWKTLIKECQSSGMTVSAWCNHPEELDNLMPWSETVKTECGN